VRRKIKNSEKSERRTRNWKKIKRRPRMVKRCKERGGGPVFAGKSQRNQERGRRKSKAHFTRRVVVVESGKQAGGCEWGLRLY